LFSRVSAVLLFATAIPAVAAAQENCRAIQDPKARLECFDNLPAAPPAANTAPKKNDPAAPKTLPNTTVDGDWQLRQRMDPMTDKLTCVILATARPYIQFSIGQLYISYAGRGGVDSYTYRIDDLPISKMQLPSPTEKTDSMISLKGQTFNQIIASSRLRVETLTYVGGIKVEDIDLDPVKRLYARMERECAK
jgi:hypothetical protein